jgi:hypothetical protein
LRTLQQWCILGVNRKIKGYAMTRIIFEIDDDKVAILVDKAKKFGLLPERLVSASIEDLNSQPDPDLEAAMRKVLNSMMG